MYQFMLKHIFDISWKTKPLGFTQLCLQGVWAVTGLLSNIVWFPLGECAPQGWGRWVQWACCLLLGGQGHLGRPKKDAVWLRLDSIGPRGQTCFFRMTQTENTNPGPMTSMVQPSKYLYAFGFDQYPHMKRIPPLLENSKVWQDPFQVRSKTVAPMCFTHY